MSKEIDDLQRITSVEIARLSLLRTPEQKKINTDRLRDLYVVFLKTAKQKPEFSLKKTLSVFRFLAKTTDPSLAKEVESDYLQMKEFGIENPFHYEYQKKK